MSTQLINGLAVEIDGEGEALLCIHGLGGSSNTWTPLMAAFAGFKVIRPDLPGSARSPCSRETLSIEAYVAALEALLAELGVESVHMMAHSLGTVVAQHFAVRNPAKVKSLACSARWLAPPEAARPEHRGACHARAQRLPRHAADRRRHRQGRHQPGDEGAAARRAGTGARKRDAPTSRRLCAKLRSTGRRRSRPRSSASACRRCSSPATRTASRRRATSRPWRSASRAAASVVLEGCGHWTTFEKPQACMQELQQFHAIVR